MKTERMILRFDDGEQRQQAIDENKLAIARTLTEQGQGSQEGTFAHEVGRIHGMGRSGMTGIVSTTWTPTDEIDPPAEHEIQLLEDSLCTGTED